MSEIKFFVQNLTLGQPSLHKEQEKKLQMINILNKSYAFILTTLLVAVALIIFISGDASLLFISAVLSLFVIAILVKKIVQQVLIDQESKDMFALMQGKS